MALRRGERNDKIFELLDADDITTIILLGKHGVGKTRMAKEVSDIKSLTNQTLWVYLNRKYDRRTLHEGIARQLSLLSTPEEWEDYDDEEEESLGALKQRVSAKLEELAREKKIIYLFLDDVPLNQNEEIVSELNTLVNPNVHYFLKVLMTSRESDSRCVTEEMKRDIENSTTRVQRVDPLSWEESLDFSHERIETKIISSPGFGPVAYAVAKLSLGIPAVIITIVEALNSVSQHISRPLSLESILEASDCNLEVVHRITRLLQRRYDMFPGSNMTNCCWHSMRFFRRRGGVHYNELITHWILEGYFGSADQIQKAYEQGHYVLMELIDYGILRKQEDNVVTMDGAVLDIVDHRRSGFIKSSSLELANVFEDYKWRGIGRTTQTDGMIKSFCSSKNTDKVSTLLMDGRRLSKEVASTFFQPMQRLQVFAIFKPRIRFLPSPFPVMTKLLVLVLRGSDQLESIDHICELTNLQVLEISGATSLEDIPDDLFGCMPNLRSVNLSESKIKSLPTTLFNRGELRWLILRGCSHLEELQSLKALRKIEVIDLSGATSLTKVHDDDFSSLTNLQMVDLSESQIDCLPSLDNLGNLTHLLLSGCSCLTRLPSLETVSGLQILDLSSAGGLEELQEQSLRNKDELRFLDLSGTSINRIPSNASNLLSLYLRDCSSLVKLPSTQEMKHLEVLNLYGACNLVDIEDISFGHLQFLRVLNFSKSRLQKLPSLSELRSLRQLLLRDCSLLQYLPEMEGLERLEILDLSGCRSLEAIEERFLEKMSYLQVLDLSETKIEFLPVLCNPSNLQNLLLRSCKNLKKLSPMDHLSKLEELNLCGASSLAGFQAQFLEDMIHLKILDLSGTPITELPSMSKIINLTQLKLRDCSLLETVQHLDALNQLEILDLSGTKVSYLPSLDNYSNLRQLLLKDCMHIENLLCLGSLSHLEVLDISGTRIQTFPYDISELTCLKHLHLPELNDAEIDWGKIKRLPEELNWNQCGILNLKHGSSLAESSKPSISQRGAGIFKHLEKNHKLWETNFREFQFFVGPIKEQGVDGDFDFCNDKVFRDIYFRTRCFPEKNDRFLEIGGSYCLPNGFESVLRHVEHLSLIDNDLICCLSDLGADNVPEIRGCWLERCTRMESILSDTEEDNRMETKLEILWMSNLPSLKSLGSGSVKTKGFKNLKHLYLDCCPMVVNVFSTSHVPENLQSLHVKFCDQLETLFVCEVEAGCRLEKLEILHLHELPRLRSIGIQLPSSVILDVVECPEFQNNETTAV